MQQTQNKHYLNRKYNNKNYYREECVKKRSVLVKANHRTVDIIALASLTYLEHLKSLHFRTQ
jgi:hypothetical protein